VKKTHSCFSKKLKDAILQLHLLVSFWKRKLCFFFFFFYTNWFISLFCTEKY